MTTSQHFYERVKSWYCLTFGSYFRCYYHVNYDYAVIILVLNIYLSLIFLLNEYAIFHILKMTLNNQQSF